ncbi:cation:proton antiporter [Streptomyces mirabilis]|uniref:cation:proton antiporter domain-containing protein n=1 Tax=Streptomyces mirabilis TaxID=68239 RepID=UPI003695D59F
MTSAGARVQITGFWEVSTFILNSALFVLVGIQTPAIVSAVGSASLGHAVVTALLVGGVVIATRLLWLYSVPYLLRAVYRRPVQRTLRSGARERFPVAWSGVRGAVSLAAALGVPATTAAGRPLEGHGLVVFTAVAVILVTLVVQGTTMPAVIRWAGLRGDPDETSEERRAHRQIVNAALEVLPDYADRLDTPPETTDAIRSELRQYVAEDAGPPDTGPGVRTGLELRRAVIGVKRSAPDPPARPAHHRRHRPAPAAGGPGRRGDQDRAGPACLHRPIALTAGRRHGRCAQQGGRGVSDRVRRRRRPGRACGFRRPGRPRDG